MRRVTALSALLLLSTTLLGTTFVPAAGSCHSDKHACCKKHRAVGDTASLTAPCCGGRCAPSRLTPTSAIMGERPSRSFSSAHPVIEEFYPAATSAPAPDAESQRAPPTTRLIPE